MEDPVAIARLLLPLALLGPLAAAQAQHPLILERLKNWNSAAPQPDGQIISKEVRAAAAKIYVARNGCDASALTIENTRPATADRFAFTSVIQGTMRNAWFVTTSIPQCDVAPVRFMIMQSADGSFQPYGSIVASLTLGTP